MTERPYQICRQLVMDTSDPTITFTADGVCHHYADFQVNVRPHWHPNAEGRRVLEATVAEIRRLGRGKSFDCLLGLSGGLDSSYMLHLMVTEFGLRPLVFHVDGGWNTDTAVHNINALIEGLGLDLVTEVINWDEMRDFQLAMFKAGVPHLDIPQDHAFVAVLYRFAREYRVPFILNGGNISTECVPIPVDLLYWGTDLRHIRDLLRRFGTVPMRTYPFSSALYHKGWLRYVQGVRVVKPLNQVPFIKAEAMDLLARTYGWKPYPQKHFESRFTRFFEGYWLPTRFGFDLRRVQFSSLILTGQMTRDEAITRLTEPPYDPSLIDQDFSFVADKLGISVAQLREYHAMPRRSYRDYRHQRWLFDLGERVLQLASGTRRGGAL